MESGLVTDQQISASSSWNKHHGPENARLNLVAARGKTGAWSAESNDRNQFLQVDFWRDVKITKFQTQGRQDWDQWVKKYTLSYSVDGSSSFQTYQENSIAKVQNDLVIHINLYFNTNQVNMSHLVYKGGWHCLKTKLFKILCDENNPLIKINKAEKRLKKEFF